MYAPLNVAKGSSVRSRGATRGRSTAVDSAGMCVHIHVYIYIIYIFMYLYIYIYLCIYVHKYTIHLYIYICVYIYTHMHGVEFWGYEEQEHCCE